MKTASDMGFCKVAALSPRVTVASPQKNAESALRAIAEEAAGGAQLIVLPELHLSAYTCGDLFEQDALIKGCEKALLWLLRETTGIPAIIAVGLPVRAGGALYNAAAVCQAGRLLGVVPKCYLPNTHEFSEKRWFVSGANAPEEFITLCGRPVPFGSLLFRFGELVLGVEICEDLWVPIPPSSLLALSGANVIANLSASNELAAKDAYRRDLIAGQSARLDCGYVYASAGCFESTTDLVFGGACTVAENGAILAEGERFSETGRAVCCLDLQKLASERRKNGSFYDNAVFLRMDCRVVESALPALDFSQMERPYDPHPFIPKGEKEKRERCLEILTIQATGLAKRMEHTGLTRAVIGISGGLDSTLALLVAYACMKRLGLPRENILCVTMPGFGTTDRTYQNALELVDSLGATLLKVDIKAACLQHFKDICHDPSVHDVTYENTQARERTQILMDLANKEGGLLVGTGDLSELAMGWCTYGGDHMSMYGVNASVPKTLVRYVVESLSVDASFVSERTKRVLRDVLDTPVSPELLPPDEGGEMKQKTEDSIGPYELHDFFLYHFLRFGFEKEKLSFLAGRAFEGKYSEAEIEKWLTLFLKRFFSSQFKRSCMPDGPKVGSVGLSPRGDFRMPSDADATAFLK